MSEGSGGFLERLFGGKKRKEAADRKALETEFATTTQRLADLDKQAAVPGWSNPNDPRLKGQLTARQDEIRKQLGIPEQNGASLAPSSENAPSVPPAAKSKPAFRPITPPPGKAK